MTIQPIPIENTGQFSSFFLDYIQQKELLKSFYQYAPNEKGIKQNIEEKKITDKDRKILVDVLNQQYQGIETSVKVKANIQALSSANTYTITTGHQLNLMTGPLYFIYKIATAIKLASELKISMPQYNFVPVFWMATEDHDFEEINHFNLFSKTYSWETNQKGAVGRFVLDELSLILGQIPDLPAEFVNAYTDSKNLSEATRKLVNHIFGNYGVVIIDGDNALLKNNFASIIEKELKEQTAFKSVSKTNQVLEELGYKAQAHAREINLFYLTEQSRARIEKKEQFYTVVGSDLSFDEENILNMVKSHPERFSPNVILRPVYQELILPNIAYIGGPAEIIYWLQLKETFEKFGIQFPVLIPRKFGMFLTKANLEKTHKLNLRFQDLFLPEDTLKQNVLSKLGFEKYHLNHEKQIVENLFVELLKQANSIDKSLVAFTEAERSKTLKVLEEIEKKFTKATERKHEETVKQALALKNKLFPNSTLQERNDNYLSIAINFPNFLDNYLEKINPLNFDFDLIIENE